MATDRPFFANNVGSILNQTSEADSVSRLEVLHTIDNSNNNNQESAFGARKSYIRMKKNEGQTSLATIPRKY